MTVPDQAAQSKTQVMKCAGLLALLMGAAQLSGVSAMAAPFSATCALLAVLPNAPFSQPRSLLLSHAICIGTGALASSLPLPMLLAAFVAAWLAISGMVYTRSLHAPAVAHTVILTFGKHTLGLYVLVACSMAAALAALAYLSVRRARPLVSPAQSAPAG